MRRDSRLQVREVDNWAARLRAPLLSQHELQTLTRHLRQRGAMARRQ